MLSLEVLKIMSHDSLEVSNQQPDYSRQFMKLILKNRGSDDDWTMGVQILGPRDETSHLMPVLGYIVITPIDNRYGLQYYEGLEHTVIWRAELDEEGNPFELEGISDQEMREELGMLLDPNSSLEDPNFKVNAIAVDTEGDFDLPEGHGFKGTILNENVHVGTIVTSFEMLSGKALLDKF